MLAFDEDADCTTIVPLKCFLQPNQSLGENTMPTRSLSEIKQLFEEKLLINPNSRERCLSILAESIKNAHVHVPNEWIVRYHPQRDTYGIHLRVGIVTPFAVEREKIWMALDEEQLSAAVQRLLDKARGWQWKQGERSHFKRVKSRNGYYLPDKDPQGKLWPIVRELNSAVFSRMGELKYKLARNSREEYQPAVLEFLRQELKQPVPEPGTYLRLSKKEDESKVFYEGARKQISVKTYERNRLAREECLKHHGSRCQVCEQYMSDIYGSAAVGLIHVHHLRPISEVQENCPVKPEKDLIPVCPNCHAVIHRRKPPYTIEEVKGFLEEAKQDV